MDDASEAAHLGSALEAALARLDVPVLIVRSTQRIGLIKARLRHSTALQTMLQGGGDNSDIAHHPGSS